MIVHMINLPLLPITPQPVIELAKLTIELFGHTFTS